MAPAANPENGDLPANADQVFGIAENAGLSHHQAADDEDDRQHEAEIPQGGWQRDTVMVGLRCWPDVPAPRRRG